MKSYRRFYLENRDKLFAYLVRMTGDYQLSSDALQESFTRILAHYGPREQSVPLLFKVARNVALDSLRRDKNRRNFEGYRQEDLGDPEADVLVREEYRQVLEAMEKLERSERDVLSLAISADLKYREIAEIAGISEENVRVKIHRARKKLRTLIRSEE